MAGLPRLGSTYAAVSADTALDYRMFSEKFGWKPIDAAPFKLTAAGWVNSGKGTPLAVTPLQWKPYVARRKKR
jgi:hypothetical protein